MKNICHISRNNNNLPDRLKISFAPGVSNEKHNFFALPNVNPEGKLRPSKLVICGDVLFFDEMSGPADPVGKKTQAHYLTVGQKI